MRDYIIYIYIYINYIIFFSSLAKISPTRDSLILQVLHSSLMWNAENVLFTELIISIICDIASLQLLLLRILDLNFLLNWV